MLSRFVIHGHAADYHPTWQNLNVRKFVCNKPCEFKLIPQSVLIAIQFLAKPQIQRNQIGGDGSRKRTFAQAIAISTGRWLHRFRPGINYHEQAAGVDVSVAFCRAALQPNCWTWIVEWRVAGNGVPRTVRTCSPQNCLFYVHDTNVNLETCSSESPTAFAESIQNRCGETIG